MDVLEQIRVMREALDRIEAEGIERQRLPEDASDDERAAWLASMEAAERAKWQSKKDQGELSALRTESNALRYELHHKVLSVATRPDSSRFDYLRLRAVQLVESFGDANIYTIAALLTVNVDDAAVLLGRARGVEDDPWRCMALAELDHLEGQS